MELGAASPEITIGDAGSSMWPARSEKEGKATTLTSQGVSMDAQFAVEWQIGDVPEGSLEERRVIHLDPPGA